MSSSSTEFDQYRERRQYDVQNTIQELLDIETPIYKDYDYVIMTNRTHGEINDKKADVKTCFDLYKGKDILFVKRNGLILSTIRKKM